MGGWLGGGVRLLLWPPRPPAAAAALGTGVRAGLGWGSEIGHFLPYQTAGDDDAFMRISFG